MRKPPNQSRPETVTEIELHPDAWDRFADFVKRIAKAGPQHRTPKAKERPASKGGVRKGKSSQ